MLGVYFRFHPLGLLCLIRLVRQVWVFAHFFEYFPDYLPAFPKYLVSLPLFHLSGYLGFEPAARRTTVAVWMLATCERLISLRNSRQTMGIVVSYTTLPVGCVSSFRFSLAIHCEGEAEKKD